MNYAVSLCILCLSVALPVQAKTTQHGAPHDRAYETPGHEAIGRPSNGASVTRTIELTLKETSSGYMLFEPDAIHIENGTVVRFKINNAGGLDHEFFLGSFAEIAEHQKWMRKYPDMKHEDANAIAISSGEQAELVWEFSSMTNLEFVCLIPGHREAGMWGVIMVHNHLAPTQNN